jgi:hypothetical protein
MVVKCGREWVGNTIQKRGKGLSPIESSTDILTNPNNLPQTYQQLNFFLSTDIASEPFPACE